MIRDHQVYVYNVHYERHPWIDDPNDNVLGGSSNFEVWESEIRQYVVVATDEAIAISKIHKLLEHIARPGTVSPVLVQKYLIDAVILEPTW